MGNNRKKAAASVGIIGILLGAGSANIDSQTRNSGSNLYRSQRTTQRNNQSNALTSATRNKGYGSKGSSKHK